MMIYKTEQENIEELFYKQIRDLTSKSTIRALESFNNQFSGRCFL